MVEKKFKRVEINPLAILENYGFTKRFNRIDGELEIYTFKISRSYFINIDIKTGYVKIIGLCNTSKGVDLITKVAELLTDKIIFVEEKEDIEEK